MARGAEGKLRFAARGALAAWPATWRENSASLRAVRGRTALQRRGKIPCCCAMRWQHGPAAWRENSVLLRGALATWPCGVEGKFRVAVCGALAAWPCGVEGKLRFAARGAWPHGPAAWRENFALLCVVRGRTALRRGGKTPCFCAMRWQHGPRCGRKTPLCCVWCAGNMALRRGGKTLLCAGGERGKQGIFYSKMYYFRKIIQKVLNFTAARPSHRRPAVC